MNLDYEGKTMNLDYESDMIIDETALDVEWLGQASLAMKYGKYYAECKRRLTQTEENVKVITAELINAVNEDPDGCLGNGIKPTDVNKEAYYRTHPRHKEAKLAWIHAQYELEIAEIAKNEVSFTRKAALENLVQLHGQNYFAGPSVPRNLSKEIIESRDRRRINDQIKVEHDMKVQRNIKEGIQRNMKEGIRRG